jgi:KaiC/GvpD/RAD55 family RecA-like ATPase
MALIGLNDVKAQFLKVKAKLEIAKRQQIDLSEEDFSVNVVGNPGTGKSLS